jgi:hypothetical protein
MQELWIEKRINENITKRFFKHYQIGILGCGKTSSPFLDLSNIAPLPNNKHEIVKELSDNLTKFKDGYNKASSMVPKELNNGKHLISHYYNCINDYLDQETIDSFKTHDEFDRYIMKEFDCRNWQNLLSPRITDTWYNKSFDTCKWTSNNTPKLNNWIESLRDTVFDQLGRVIVFNSKVDEPILMHRDFHYRKHSSHFINFQFSGVTNIAYVYDEITKQKIYSTSPCYMFNETDLHGVDSCSTPRFTVRVDGVFKSHISELLNLNNGNVWDDVSLSYNKINNITILEP